MNFGTISIVFQDCQIVQIEKLEKFRVTRNKISSKVQLPEKNTISNALLNNLQNLLQSIAYGQIIISVKNGCPVYLVRV